MKESGKSCVLKGEKLYKIRSVSHSINNSFLSPKVDLKTAQLGTLSQPQDTLPKTLLRHHSRCFVPNLAHVLYSASKSFDLGHARYVSH